MTKDELCEEGQRLWDAVDYRKVNSYDDYRRHLLECKRCQDGLNLIDKDLVRIRDDVENEGYQNRRKLK